MQIRIRLVLSLILASAFGAACNKPASDNAGKETAAATVSPAATTPSNAAQVVEVTGLDYAFSVPDTLDAGRTAFKFTNKGKVFHEYNIVLLKESATIEQFIDAMNKDVTVKPFVDGAVGVLFADPGKTSSGYLTTEMLPGRTYAIQCIFKDSGAVKTHREMGMYKVIKVRTAAAPSVAAVPIDTIVGSDYAYLKYPRTIAPGWHRFAFVNQGKQRHEISLGLMKPGVTLPQVMDIVKKDGDWASVFDGDFGVLHSPAGTAPLGTLDFEVLPGREYIIICTFQDDPKAAPHFMLGMVTSMVSSK